MRTLVLALLIVALALIALFLGTSDHAKTGSNTAENATQRRDAAKHAPSPKTAYDPERPAPVLPAITAALKDYSGCEDNRFDPDRLWADQFDGQRDALAKRRQAARRILAVSDNPEQLFVAALLTKDVAERMLLLRRALAAAPNDPGILMTALRLCRQYPDTDNCDIAALLQQLVAIDSDNGEAWALVAADAYDKGDSEATLRALREAASTSRSSSYYHQTILRLERALRVAEDISFSQRVVDSIGIAAAVGLPELKAVVAMCRAPWIASEDRLIACQQYAESAERYADTILVASVGNSVQQIIFEYTNDKQRLAATAIRRTTLSAALQMPQTNVQLIAQALIGLEPAVFYNYFGEAQVDGELFAITSLQAQVRDALASQGITECTTPLKPAPAAVSDELERLRSNPNQQ